VTIRTSEYQTLECLLQHSQLRFKFYSYSLIISAHVGQIIYRPCSYPNTSPSSARGWNFDRFADFGLWIAQNAFSGRATPGPAGEVWRFVIRERLGRGRKGLRIVGKGGRGWGGRRWRGRERRKGKGKDGKGKEGKGRVGAEGEG